MKIEKLTHEEIMKKSGLSNIEVRVVSRSKIKEIITTGILSGVGGYYLGRGISEEYGGLIGSISGIVLGCFTEGLIQRDKNYK
jgi:hypothetical protein